MTASATATKDNTHHLILRAVKCAILGYVNATLYDMYWDFLKSVQISTHCQCGFKKKTSLNKDDLNKMWMKYWYMYGQFLKEVQSLWQKTPQKTTGVTPIGAKIKIKTACPII